MFQLFKATAIVSMASITTILVGLIRAKFTALRLGPSGVGIFSQAFNFQQLAITISSLSIGVGMMKYISQYNSQDDDSKVIGIITSAFFMQLIVAAALVAAGFIFANPLSQFMFSAREYSPFVPLLCIGMLFFVMAGTVESIFFGFGNYRAFAKGRSVSNLLSLIPLFIFVGALYVKGGFIYLAANSVLTLLVYYYIFKRVIPQKIRRGIFEAASRSSMKKIIGGFSRPLLSYGATSFATSILGMVNVVFLRSLVIRYFGAEANGYYQVVFTLSAYYIAFFTNGLWSYFYQKISAMKDAGEYSREVNSAMRFCIFGMMTFIVGFFLFRGFLIKLIFSGKFMSSEALFATQLSGDLFFILYYILGTSLLASARLKAYLGFNCLYSASFIGIFLILGNFLQVKAITASYLLTNAILFLALFYYHVSRMHFKMAAENRTLLLSAVLVCILALFFGKETVPFFIFKAALLVAWLAMLSTEAEKKRLWNLILRKTKTLFGGESA